MYNLYLYHKYIYYYIIFIIILLISIYGRSTTEIIQLKAFYYTNEEIKTLIQSGLSKVIQQMNENIDLEGNSD